MLNLDDYKPFYANDDDKDPKIIIHTWSDDPVIKSWLPPADGTYELKNTRLDGFDGVSQDVGDDWNEAFLKTSKALVFLPSKQEYEYKLVNVTRSIQEIPFGEPDWRIISWEIIAADINDDSKALSLDEVNRRIANDEDFLTLDLITWQKLDINGEVLELPIKRTGHGYAHYKTN